MDKNTESLKSQNLSIFRSYPIYWIYGKIRSNVQKYIDDTFEATQIIKNLWVGGICSPSNDKNMKKHNIKMIVSAHVGASALYPYQFEYRLVELLDLEDENIFQNFENILPQIHEVIHNNKGVLVHCMMGASRSVTIVAAYLMKYHHMSASDSIKFMKSIRKEVNPNKGYIKQLYKYQNFLKYLKDNKRHLAN